MPPDARSNRTRKRISHRARDTLMLFVKVSRARRASNCSYRFSVLNVGGKPPPFSNKTLLRGLVLARKHRWDGWWLKQKTKRKNIIFFYHNIFFVFHHIIFFHVLLRDFYCSLLFWDFYYCEQKSPSFHLICGRCFLFALLVSRPASCPTATAASRRGRALWWAQKIWWRYLSSR